MAMLFDKVGAARKAVRPRPFLIRLPEGEWRVACQNSICQNLDNDRVTGGLNISASLEMGRGYRGKNLATDF